MKNAADLVKDSPLDSPEEHKQIATTLMRLAGGLNTESTRAYFYDLSDKERRALSDAALLLTKMANVRKEAMKIKAGKLDAQKNNEKKMIDAMADNFSKLSTVADKVSLVAAVSPYRLTNWGNKNSDDLDRYFADALEQIAFRLASQPGTVVEAVSKVWGNYIGNRAKYELSFRNIIAQLTKHPSSN